MSVLHKLASTLNRDDEIPNQELAQELIASRDQEAIQELVDHLTAKDKAVASDCIKVLYEIGAVQHDLIAPYVDEFANLLRSKNNRMVWGAMTALGAVADQRAAEIGKHLDTLIDATQNGSVITQDWGVRVLAAVAAQEKQHIARIVPFLLGFLQDCPAKDLPRHAESALPAMEANFRTQFLEVVEARQPELKPTQAKRLAAVIQQAKG